MDELTQIESGLSKDELTQIESRLSAALTCIHNVEEFIDEKDYDNALIFARSAEEKIALVLYCIRQITHKED